MKDTLMKKILILTLILCGFHSAYAQQDLIKEVSRQAVVIDSLQKDVGFLKNNNKQMTIECQNNLKNLTDTIRSLKSDLSELEKFKASKKIIDDQLKQKNDSIALLKNQIYEKGKQISDEKTTRDKYAREEYEKGKQSVSANVANSYTNESFDDLIKSSTKLSVQRDIQLVGSNPGVQPILSDLKTYFNAKELLEKKFDAAQVKNAQSQLHQIKQESVLLEELKEIIENYQNFNEGLKNTIMKIVVLDKDEIVAGMSNSIQDRKFIKISSYIFDYDFNLLDYPYLSDIALEIIKLKQPDADADISDLLKRL